RNHHLRGHHRRGERRTGLSPCERSRRAWEPAMSAVLFDSISRIARHEAQARAVAGIGKVTDVFTANGPQDGDYSVTVQMRDTGLILPKVPVAVGPMGFASIPDVGDLAVVVFMEGDYNAPVVVGRVYQPDIPPPEH